jgi:hypothetical protein
MRQQEIPILWFRVSTVKQLLHSLRIAASLLCTVHRTLWVARANEQLQAQECRY